MSEVIEFASSWALAEQTVYRRMLAATASQDKKSAFLGYLPPYMVNVWAFNTGPDGGNAQTLWTDIIVSVHVQASLVCRFIERSAAQTWVMNCVGAMAGCAGLRNVQAFRVRLGGFPRPEVDVIEQPNSEKKIAVFQAEIGCELVFNTLRAAPEG